MIVRPAEFNRKPQSKPGIPVCVCASVCVCAVYFLIGSHTLDLFPLEYSQEYYYYYYFITHGGVIFRQVYKIETCSFFSLQVLGFYLTPDLIAAMFASSEVWSQLCCMCERSLGTPDVSLWDWEQDCLPFTRLTVQWEAERTGCSCAFYWCSPDASSFVV